MTRAPRPRIGGGGGGRNKGTSLWPLACLGISLAAIGCGSGSSREIVLVARGMSFVLPERPDEPNPLLSLRAGERVRLVLRNEAPGLLHDIRIPAWNVQVDQIRAGETADVTFTVPGEVGRTEYRCQPHGELMKGMVEVTR